MYDEDDVTQLYIEEAEVPEAVQPPEEVTERDVPEQVVELR